MKMHTVCAGLLVFGMLIGTGSSGQPGLAQAAVLDVGEFGTLCSRELAGSPRTSDDLIGDTVGCCWESPDDAYRDVCVVCPVIADGVSYPEHCGTQYDYAPETTETTDPPLLPPSLIDFDDDGRIVLSGEPLQFVEDHYELKGYVSDTYRPNDITEWDYNRCVPDPAAQVARLVPDGEVLGFRMHPALPDPGCLLGCRDHWQGIQRLPLGNGRHFVVSMSEHDHPDRAFLTVVQLGSSSGDGRRLGGNRMRPTAPDWENAPPSDAKVVDWVSVEDWWHPGGLQTLGRYVFMPVEARDGFNAKVIAYDMGGIQAGVTQPEHLWDFEVSAYNSKDGAASAAVAKLQDGRYLLVVTPGSNSEALDFYVSEAGYHIREAGVFGELREPDVRFEKDENGDFRTYFQNINLLTGCDGQLYLLGTTKSGDALLGDNSDKDRVELYEVNLTKWIDSQPPTYTMSLRHRATREMRCTASSSDSLQCDFDAAAGAYVDPDGRLLLYATEHANDGPGGSVKMMEYRPENHLDNPDTPEVEGCTSLDEAFVEMHGIIGSMGGIVARPIFLMEGRTISQRDYGHFGVAYDMNDKVHSVKFCIPAGYQFTFFAHEDYNAHQAGNSETLPANFSDGQIHWGYWETNPMWSSGRFMGSGGGSGGGDDSGGGGDDSGGGGSGGGPIYCEAPENFADCSAK